MSERTRTWVRVAAVAVPIVVAAAMGPARAVLPNTDAALVLVLVVVAVAVAGDRPAGLLAALSAAASFDYFLAPPLYRFTIGGREDIETAVLLLVIGAAVVEVARWGRRQAARSSRRAGYLDGVAHAADLAAGGSPAAAESIAAMIGEVLDLDACRFEPGPGDASSGRPVLHRDGSVTWAGRPVDVRREGLPGMDVIELPAGHGPDDGRFLLTASTEDRRPGREQLLVAVTLAGQCSAVRTG